MKRETRPYSHADATQGAPYGARSEEYDAMVLHAEGTQLLGATRKKGGSWLPTEWTRDGMVRSEPAEHPRDVVMLPLGMVEGKPFFVGDRIVGNTGESFIAEPSDMGGTHKTWKWPKPAQNWPKSSMTADQLKRAFHAATPESRKGWCGIADIAIAHECEAGTLIPAERLFKLANGSITIYGKAGDVLSVTVGTKQFYGEAMLQKVAEAVEAECAKALGAGRAVKCFDYSQVSTKDATISTAVDFNIDTKAIVEAIRAQSLQK